MFEIRHKYLSLGLKSNGAQFTTQSNRSIKPIPLWHQLSYDYKRGLDWWPDLLDSDTTRDPRTLSLSLSLSSVHSHVFTSRCLAEASNSGRSPSYGFPKCLRPQPPASNSNSSQQLNPGSYPTNSLTHQPTHSLTH
jgi:hypothetical protein